MKMQKTTAEKQDDNESIVTNEEIVEGRGQE